MYEKVSVAISFISINGVDVDAMPINSVDIIKQK